MIRHFGGCHGRWRVSWIILATLLACGPGIHGKERDTAGAAPAKRVLLLFSDARLLPANVTVDETIRRTLTEEADGPVEVYSEFLDPARFPGQEQVERQSVFFRDRYGKNTPDLIIAAGTPALGFLVQFRDSLFPQVPIVHCGVGDRNLLADLPDTGIVGIPVDGDPAASLDLALRLQPGTREVAVVAGSSARDRWFIDNFRETVPTREPRVRFTWLTDLSIEDLRTAVSHLPHDSIVYYLALLEDAEGRHFTPRDALDAFAPACAVPIYATMDSYLGHGIVGGSMVPFEEIGRKAARVGLRILSGEAPADAVKSERHEPVAAFDWNELRRWGIREDRLPPGSLVLFREPTYWDTHRNLIVTAGSVCVLEGLLIVLLIRQIRHRVRAERTARNLGGRLIHAQEETRRKMARELHDDLSQRLALLSVNLELFGQNPPSTASEITAAMSRFSDQAKASSSELHRLSHALHPAKLDQLGLETALRGFCREFGAAHDLTVRFDTHEVPGIVPDDTALCLYRIAQEALQNVAKHSGATTAEVSLRREGKDLALTVTDNGGGFDPDADGSNGSLGLVGMAERARFAGGRFDIGSRPGGGTRVEARAPLGDGVS